MACCILSKFYIKPQLIPRSDGAGYVVSYRNSTSNHNSSAGWRTPAGLYLIEILHQTTTGVSEICLVNVLYLIEILHQTTTVGPKPHHTKSCILSKFYIKPQHQHVQFSKQRSCILSKFYIKPQLVIICFIEHYSCILSKFYIKPQLVTDKTLKTGRCILSKFYIKPQQQKQMKLQQQCCILSKFYIKPQQQLNKER